MASVRTMLKLLCLVMLAALAKAQDEKHTTPKIKETTTAINQDLEEENGKEEEGHVEASLQDLYLNSNNPVVVSYLATPRDLSQLDAIIRRQRQIRFKSSYQELPVVLRRPVGAKDLTGLSYFIRVDVDEDPPPSTALTLLPEGARTYFPPQVTTPHRKEKSGLDKDKKGKDEDRPLFLQELAGSKTSKSPQGDGRSKPGAAGDYRENSDHVTSKTSSTSTASRLIASPPSSSFFSAANPTGSRTKDPKFIAKGLTVSSRFTTFPQNSRQTNFEKSLASGQSSSSSHSSKNLIIHNSLSSDSTASSFPSPSDPHSSGSNVSGSSGSFHSSSIVTSQPILIFESPGTSSSKSSSSHSFMPSAPISPGEALKAPSQYLELPNVFPLHPGVSLPTQSLDPAPVSQSFATPASPFASIESPSQHLELPSFPSHSSRPSQIIESTDIPSPPKTPPPPNPLRLSKAIQVFSHPSSQSTRPFHELSSIIDNQSVSVLPNAPSAPVSLKISQELEPPSHPFPQSGRPSNSLPTPSPLSSNPSRPTKSFPRSFPPLPPPPPPLQPSSPQSSRPKGTPASSSSASSITTASLGAKTSSSLAPPAPPAPAQKLSQDSMSASKLQANINTFSKHRPRLNQTPLTSSKVADPRPSAKAKSISSKPVNSIQPSEALQQGRSEGRGQGGGRGSGDRDGRQIKNGIRPAPPTDGKTRTVHNSDDPYANSIPGRSGIDYPTFQTLPKTGFDCASKQSGGYYADPEADCQVFHVCWGRRKASFLCPVGTLFNQEVLVCDWWYNVDCAASPEHEGVNAGIWEPRVTRNQL
ncbi:flocculation protein FLO11-like [Penaeus japonicus]|uniref:flocculation protein FLO11-like n=1 Tax=Penaeus japonicus TaxID=27405 RepID=UPI001C70D6A3|nr:flocculation protein FLO11-like [Penaeus japonicus]